MDVNRLIEECSDGLVEAVMEHVRAGGHEVEVDENKAKKSIRYILSQFADECLSTEVT